MSKIISQIKSLYKKKESQENNIISNENKNYSIKVQLTSENMLNIIPIKKNQKTNNNSIDKLLRSLTTTKKNSFDLHDSDFLQKHVSILLDDTKLEDDQLILNKNSISILLNKSSKYDIETVVDE